LGRFLFVVTHIFPYPPSHGTELRIFKLLKALQSEGYRVVLVLCEEPSLKEHLNELLKFVDAVYWVRPAWRTRLGRRFPRLRRLVWVNIKPLIELVWIPRDIPKSANLYEMVPSTVGDERKKKGVITPQVAVLVSKLACKYKPIAVIAEYIFLTDCFALLEPDILKIVDTIDVFSLREEQVAVYGIEDDPWTSTPEEERAYLLRADLIIAIHEREARVLQDLVPERKVLTVGIDFDVDNSVCSKLVSSDTITVVASGTPLNVKGLNTFFAECWPDIKSAYPSATLHVVGTIGALCKIQDPSINYTPRAENLSEVYRQSRVVINPTIAGTGLKVKSAEALAHGKPLVAWPLGVDGLDYQDAPPYMKCESWKEFAEAVIHILQSESEAQSLGNRALEYAKVRFDRAKVYAPLSRYLRGHAAKRDVCSI
jgi:glycosyltransferase involved in cell wall biosynthesis